MSEVLLDKSPLDTIRRINQSIGQWDQDIEMYGGASQLEANVRFLTEFEKKLPFMNEGVAVSGVTLVPGIIGDELKSGLIAVAQNQDEVHGIYRGLTILKAGDGMSSETFRVVHMIETGRFTYPDEFLNTKVEIYNSYVCVDGSSIRPIEPVNAHSLEDLEKDYATEELTEMIYQDNDDRLVILQSVGRYIGNLLQSKSVKTISTNHQRVSFVNATGILEDKKIYARDFVRGHIATGEAFDTSTDFCFSESPVEITPGNFAVLSGYRRFVTASTQQKYGGHVQVFKKEELYVRGTMGKDTPVLVPIKHIVEVV